LKLDMTQIEHIRVQTGIQPIPELEPSQSRLEEHFGEHTFYVDPLGLYIWEIFDESETAQKEVMALQIASWADEDMTMLQTHEAPKATGKVVVLEAMN
jgi:hypothetical protein